MNNFFSAILGTVILAGTILEPAHAQTMSIASNNSKPSISTNYNIMDSSNDVIIANSSINVHPKAIKDLAKNYKQATNIYWLKSTDGGVVAGFTAAEIKNWVTYNKNGRWLFGIKRYDATKLPNDIQASIKSAYPNYTILGADEIEIPQKVIYLINIYYKNTLIKLRVCNGEIEEQETFNGFHAS